MSTENEKQIIELLSAHIHYHAKLENHLERLRQTIEKLGDNNEKKESCKGTHFNNTKKKLSRAS